MSRTCVLLVNLGTPDSPAVKDVKRYLSEFLNDPLVIDIPWLWRKLLVNCIIVPFRAPKSAKAYEKLWTKGGDKSPIATYSVSVAEQLKERFAVDGVEVRLAMRYENPSIRSVVEGIKKDGFEKVVLVPLYPQYALASTETVIREFNRSLANLNYAPEVNIVRSFYDDAGYLDAFANRAWEFDLERYDHVLFSYHGLPVRQIEKTHTQPCNDECIAKDFPTNPDCYKAQCYATTRGLVSRLKIAEGKYSVGFQSRLDNKWITPFSDKLLIDLAQKGAKKVLVFSPAFVADCLETIIEIEDEYRELFREHGGEQLDLVPSLNDGADWVDALKQLVGKYL